MANEGFIIEKRYLVFNSLLIDTRDLLMFDVMGLYFPQMIRI